MRARVVCFRDADRLQEGGRAQFSPAPGTYTGTQYVSMSSATPGAVIVYTTDGSAPSCEKERGTIYSAPVAVATNTTLRAMACALLRAESPITTGAYVIRPPEPVAAAGVRARRRAIHRDAVRQHRHRDGRRDHPLHQRRQRPHLHHRHGVRRRHRSCADVTLNAIGCAAGNPDSAVVSAGYIITPPAAAPVFDPAPGAYTSVQHVTLASATPGATFKYTTDGQWPVCGGNTPYTGPIEISNSLTLKAVACARGYSVSPVTSGGYDITLPPPPSVWTASTSTMGPTSPRGSHITNEDGDAVNVSGRGKVESAQQVFRFVYANVTGDFMMTARLDGVDFAGLASSQARVGLLLTPDITATGQQLHLRLGDGGR